MKVFYKKKIQERIFDEIQHAASINKKIDHIDLTKKEWDELSDYIRHISFFNRVITESGYGFFCGVKIIVDGKEPRN